MRILTSQNLRSDQYRPRLSQSYTRNNLLVANILERELDIEKHCKMSPDLLDAESILSFNEQWKELDEKWGEPVDLETEEIEDYTPKLKPVFSSLDLRGTTFDSPFIMKTVKKTIGRVMSKKSVVDYKDFLQDLQHQIPEVPKKQFYYINGQILSAYSVEDICDKIDDIFKSVEKLCSVQATSTIRHKKSIPEVVHCSISYEDLSFDDTADSEKEKGDSDDVDRYIDEAFEQLNSTLTSIAQGLDDETARDSVTTLVRKFSSILNNPVMCSPRRKRQCGERFKDLAEFWRSRAFDITE